VGRATAAPPGIGLTEYRDVIGSLRYTAARPDTKTMKKALLSVCLGAESTAVAWSKHPEEFPEIQAMVMLQPVSGRSAASGSDGVAAAGSWRCSAVLPGHAASEPLADPQHTLEVTNGCPPALRA
jgi:hypothetical protein